MDYHLGTEYTFQGLTALESQQQTQEDKARVHCGESPPAEAALTTLKTFCLFPEACCMEMGIRAKCSRKAPLELGRAITTGAWGRWLCPCMESGWVYISTFP